MRSKGFTLVEVLVAFTILAIVMGVTFATIGSGISQERRATATTYRVMAARSILEGLGIENPLESGEFTGALETGESWQLIVQAMLPDDEDAGEAAAAVFYHADLTIYDDGKPVLNFVTLKRAALR